MPAGFLLPAENAGNKKADPANRVGFSKPWQVLLAAGFFQHAQGALVGFVSGLLSFLSSGQSLVSLAVGFVGTSLSASSSVFGSGQTSFGFFGQAAATGSQNGGQGQSREFQNVVHRVPLKVHFSMKKQFPESGKLAGLHTTHYF